MQRIFPPPVDNDQELLRTVDGPAVSGGNGALLPHGVLDARTERVLEVDFCTHNHPGTGS